MKLFIICGNHQEYQEFVNKKISSLTESFRITDFVYVSSPKAFVGHSNPHGWFIGTWRELPDIREILEVMATCYHDQKVPESVIDAWQKIV